MRYGGNYTGNRKRVKLLEMFVQVHFYCLPDPGVSCSRSGFDALNIYCFYYCEQPIISLS